MTRLCSDNQLRNERQIALCESAIGTPEYPTPFAAGRTEIGASTSTGRIQLLWPR